MQRQNPERKCKDSGMGRGVGNWKIQLEVIRVQTVKAFTCPEESVMSLIRAGRSDLIFRQLWLQWEAPMQMGTYQ